MHTHHMSTKCKKKDRGGGGTKLNQPFCAMHIKVQLGVQKNLCEKNAKNATAQQQLMLVAAATDIEELEKQVAPKYTCTCLSRSF